MLNATSDVIHQTEATRLAPEPYVELFKFIYDYLQPNQFIAFYESPNNHLARATYENFSHQFSGYNIQSTGEQSRPKLQVANPNGLFSNLLVNGTLRQAQLIRYLVLRSDLLADESRYPQKQMVNSQDFKLTKSSVNFEMRSVLDGVRYTLPARQYISP